MKSAKLQVVNHETAITEAQLLAVIDLDEAQELEAIRRGSRARLRRGARFLFVKLEGKRSGLIPHGEFGPWLAKHRPHICYRAIAEDMQLIRLVCEEVHLPLPADVLDEGPEPEDWSAESKVRPNSLLENKGEKSQKVSTFSVLGGFRLHELLDLPADSLPPEARELQADIFALIDGQTSRQLLYRFRNVPGAVFEPPPKEKPTPQSLREGEKAVARMIKEDLITHASASHMFFVDPGKHLRGEDGDLERVLDAYLEGIRRMQSVLTERKQKGRGSKLTNGK